MPMPNIPTAAATQASDAPRGVSATAAQYNDFRARQAMPRLSGPDFCFMAPRSSRPAGAESAERPRKRLRLLYPGAPLAGAGFIAATPPRVDAGWSPPSPYKPAGTYMKGNGPNRKHGVLVGDGKRTEPLQQHQINEAGYLTARASMGLPIDDTAGDLRRVVDGNETVHETRVLFSGGRGNVTEDSISTGGTSGPRVEAARMVAAATARIAADMAATPGCGHAVAVYLDTVAAASLAVAAGNCCENSAVAARLHAPNLQGQETVSQIGSTSFDHAWAEIETPHRLSVVLDPWANGPAMQAGDTVWRTPGRLVAYPIRPGTQDTTAAPLTVGSTTKMQTFSAGAAGTAAKAVMFDDADYFARGPGRDTLDAALRNRSKIGPLKTSFMLSPPLAACLDPSRPGFGEKARLSLQSHVPLRQEILALGAMREGYQMNVATAAVQAQSVLEAAQTLDTMPDKLARPPLWKPPGALYVKGTSSLSCADVPELKTLALFS